MKGSRPADRGLIPRGAAWPAALLLVIAVLAAYHNTFAVPFVFDDDESIVNNPAIRRLWPPDTVLFGEQEAGMTSHGRPVLNLSLAVNQAISGPAVWSYHVVNLAIHALAGLVLFGLARRTLARPVLAARFGAHAQPLALAMAAIWLLHPLQTESVTYVIQRAESLTGLFYLLTLYGLVRAGETVRPAPWLRLSVAACLLGMATKEVMVSAPLLSFLYDRTFVAGTFGAAWRARRTYYLGLAATWLPLAALVAASGGRGDSAGFDTVVSAGTYLLTQCAAVVHYLRLTVWPHPLVLDYGTAVVHSPAEVWWQALLLAALAAGTVWAVVRRPVLGFAGVWFFALLAPSSSFVPVATQTMAEHRMYLALAAPVVLFVTGLHRLLGRWAGGGGLVLAAGLGLATIARNADYASRLSLWSDTVAKRPENARAHNNLAIELAVVGRSEEAIVHLEEALRLEPGRTDARINLANELLRQARLPEAIAQYEQVLRAKPGDVLALGNLGVALLQAGRLVEAEARYRQLLALDPADASAHANLGYLHWKNGRLAAAVAEYEEALRLEPDNAAARAALAQLRRP